MKVLIATSNSGKVQIYSNILDKLGIDWCSLKSMKVDVHVEETGTTTQENAILKAKAYHQATGMPVICNDSGLIIEKLLPSDQPGVWVRRFGGKELSDQELIDVFAKKIKDVGGSSESYFDIGVAIVDEKGKLYSKSFKSPRLMVDTPSKTVIKGIPLRSLDYDKVSGRYMSEMTMDEANAYEGKCMQDQIEFICKCFGIKKRK